MIEIIEIRVEIFYGVNSSYGDTPIDFKLESV